MNAANAVSVDVRSKFWPTSDQHKIQRLPPALNARSLMEHRTDIAILDVKPKSLETIHAA